MRWYPDILISIDIDNTAFDTDHVLRNRLIERGLTPPAVGEWIDLSQYGDVGRELLTDGEFMRLADLRAGWEEFGDWVRQIRAQYHGHVDFQWLTQRGYHPMAESLTRESLRRNHVDHIRLRCIDAHRHPNKGDWLEANTRVGVHHILVDDFNNVERVPVGRVRYVVATQRWNQCLEGVPRFSTFPQLREWLLNQIRLIMEA